MSLSGVAASPAIGMVIETNGIRAICRIDGTALRNARQSAAGTNLSAYSVGGLVRIAVGGRLLIGTIGEIAEDRADLQSLLVDVEYIGEGDSGPDGSLTGFRRGIDTFPHPGDPVAFAVTADYAHIFAPPDQPHIMLGTVYPTEEVKAPILFDSLLGRHFAVVGSTGTGKSTTVSLLLDRIVSHVSHGHVLILDPHGEYASAFGPRAKLWDVSSLRLPYWAMNLAEHCESFITSTNDEAVVDRNIMAKCLSIARSRNVRLRDSDKITADSPVPYHLADLTGALDEEAGKLEKLADAGRYTQLRLSIEQRFADPRFSFIFNPDRATDTLEDLICDLFRLPDEGMPISIIDLAGVPTEIVNVVVATLSRLVLDFAIRSPREDRTPVLLVCEEAHRYLPDTPTPQTTSVRRQLERIAREGRKYGVCLGLVSQRPSELSETALSQCGTILSMRLNNVEDQRQLRACLSEGARHLVDVIASLRNRECVISGDGVPVPMRITIDTVEVERKPDSADELFSGKWNQPGRGRAVVDQIVKRWREGESR